MIVIFSYPDEESTNKVIEWLNYYNCNFKRIHLQNEDFRNIEVHLTDKAKNIFLKLSDGTTLNFNDVSCFFYRGMEFVNFKVENDTNLPDNVITKYLNYEFLALVNYFYSTINKKSIGWINNDCLNKLTQLEIAIEVGLSTSEILVTNTQEAVAKYFGKKNVITKAIQENIAINLEEEIFIQRVQKVTIGSLNEKFFPSLFQREVVKNYEIRTFYLDKECFSIAIISSSKKTDCIDMREHYRTNYFEPYRLPKKIENKIVNLMEKLHLTSGSIDLIRGVNGKYYFLEVNPVGQYDWVSVYGGYDLDQKIAFYLNKLEKRTNETKSK